MEVIITYVKQLHHDVAISIKSFYEFIILCQAFSPSLMVICNYIHIQELLKVACIREYCKKVKCHIREFLCTYTHTNVYTYVHVSDFFRVLCYPINMSLQRLANTLAMIHLIFTSLSHLPSMISVFPFASCNDGKMSQTLAKCYIRTYVTQNIPYGTV